MKLLATQFHRKSLPLGAFFAFVWVASCGPSQESKEEEGAASETSGTTVVVPSGSAPTSSRLISIPVTFPDPVVSGISFGLSTPVDGYEISLEGCKSQYSTTVTKVDGDLEVYRYDRDCKAKLTEVTYEGVTYYPTVGDPFSTWQAGDAAIFDEVGEPGTNPLQVVIVSTLGNPVTGSEVISYGIRYLLEGESRSILWTSVGSFGDHEFGGNTAPSFTVDRIELVELSASEAGRFRFVLECTAGIGVTNVCATVDFSDLDYKLIEDTFGSAPTLGDLDSAFSGGGETAVTLPDDRIAPGDEGTANGGIFTAVLDGPDTLFSKPNMLLVIRSYGASYQYFNVDVTTSAAY